MKKRKLSVEVEALIKAEFEKPENQTYLDVFKSLPPSSRKRLVDDIHNLYVRRINTFFDKRAGV